MWEYIQGLGWIAILIGILGLAMWKGYLLSVAKPVKTIALIVGVVFLVGGALGLGWLEFGTTEAVATDGAVDWDTSCAEAEAEVVQIGDSKNYEWRTNFNTTANTFGAATDVAVFNFTIQRADQNVVAAFTSAEVSDVGSFTAVSGVNAGTTKDLIALAATGHYNIDWTYNSGDGTGYIAKTDSISTAFPRESDHRDGWMTCTITLSGAAVDLMTTVGDSGQITIDVASDTYTITVRATTINT